MEEFITFAKIFNKNTFLCLKNLVPCFGCMKSEKKSYWLVCTGGHDLKRSSDFRSVEN